MSCIMAATGGLMFGYDVGVSGIPIIYNSFMNPFSTYQWINGGVTSMPAFLEKFFPVVARKTQDPTLNNSNYCKYDNQGLQLFTSSLYLAGLTATFFASYTTRTLGRRPTMLIAGLFFIAGVVLNAAAQDLAMLIVGRILLGCGVGFANQAVPLFLSEIAPTRIRGALNILFQLNVTIGILFANLINYGTAKIKGGWGWRLSLGLAGVPAVLLTVGALLVSETPNSLIERGRLDEGKAVLRKIRGTDKIEPEFLELVEASRIAKEVKHPFRNLLKRKNRPPLVISIALQIFQQCTGINAIMFYAPVLFNTVGFGSDASLYSAVITGAAFLSMLCHFKFGIFLFFSGWVAVMSVFVFFLVPETKNVPIEEMTDKVWAQHWLWKRFVEEDGDVEMEGRVGVNGKGNGSNGVDYSS
ncbi:unnamed protein product [Linum tenue]|uniref:Major facilitator superfamily (MFS) profile domain-containing protein n=1 Tax=Linum tenue TaxID=586396 RepID=A0AAV0I1U7_9ROSI|nr:unnamed protein product [Linum tenue]